MYLQPVSFTVSFEEVEHVLLWYGTGNRFATRRKGIFFLSKLFLFIYLVLTDFLFQKVRRTFSELRDDINNLAAGFLQGCRGMLLCRYSFLQSVLLIRIWDPVPFFTPGSGMGKKIKIRIRIGDEHPGSYFRKLGNNFFG
jgi:hypothetical protein